MDKPTPAPSAPDRSSGGKRWSVEEDERLLDLVRQEQDWRDIATAFGRSFSSVQDRFRFLKNSQACAASIVPRRSIRAKNPTPPDLTCGAPSRAGRDLLSLVRNDIDRRQMIAGEPRPLIDEIDLILGAIIREVMLLRSDAHMDWVRITVAEIRTHENGIGKEAMRAVINELEKRLWIERGVGYPGLVELPRQARIGRLILIRAAPRLLALCERIGISPPDLFNHFPSLNGS